MSQYVILIETSLASDDLKESRCALVTSSNPPSGLEHLQDYCPIPIKLIHSIQAANRTDYLLKTLQIKFKQAHRYSFWYDLNTEQIAFIKSITAENLSNMIGLIHKAERKPDLNRDEVSALIAASLATTEKILKNE